MPGIHVRACSCDSLQGKKSVLTVPGSYWLCHKKNIYKFSFRYHRTFKGTKQFEYARELMKIIRRVIKYQPQQGQQFGTNHLLVTYNHTSWTRQDKMFAILKFSERKDASAFSRAFVLTIKIVSSPERLLDNARNGIVLNEPNYSLFNDRSKISFNISNVSTKMNSENVISTEKGESPLVLSIVDEKIKPKTTEIIDLENNSAFPMRTDNDIRTSNILLEEIRKSPETSNATTIKALSLKEKQNATLSKKNEEHIKNRVIINDQKNLNKKSLSKTNSNNSMTKYCKDDEDNNELKNMIHKKYNETSESTKSNKYVDLSDNDSNEFFISNRNKNQNTIETDDMSLDSTSLPYQYLIEKEIESTRDNPSHNSDEDIEIVSESKINSRMRNIETGDGLNAKINAFNRYSMETDIIKENRREDSAKNKMNKADRRKQKIKELEKEKRILPEENYLRSSNITNQVMEGLMFTIRKDQDTVSVVEQKTKLEVDEVLENSEKVETKEGEKCLVNSSLLRLENLITKIELPEEKTKKTENSLEKQGTSKLLYTDNSQYSTNDTSIDDYMYNSSIINDLNTDELSYSATKREVDDYFKDDGEKMEVDEKEEDEDDEDIIPEAFQCNITPDKSSYLDILMADIDVEDSEKAKYIKEFKKNTDFLNNHQSYSYSIESSFKDLPKSFLCETSKKWLQYNDRSNNKYNIDHTDTIECKVPKIISDKIISINEIPPALQEVIKQNFHLKGTEMASNKPKLTSAILDNEPQPSTSKEADTFQTIKITDNTTKDMSSTSSSSNAYQHDHRTSKIPLSTQNQFLEDPMNTDTRKVKNTRTNIKKFKKGSTYVVSKHFILPNKLQDITEDFFNEMLEQQKKNTSSNQRILRQRKRSNNTKDLKNSEIRVEMLKFIQDITRGAKVVVQRLSTKSISNILGKSSSLTTCMN